VLESYYHWTREVAVEVERPIDKQVGYKADAMVTRLLSNMNDNVVKDP
tara:strand:+ start:22683 stop:22826 length:144 start_codon:yes stop_codon:yes gene_type:complete